MVNANYSVYLDDLNFFRVGARIIGIFKISVKDNKILFSLITNVVSAIIHLMPSQPQHPDWCDAVKKYINLSKDSKVISKEVGLKLFRSLQYDRSLSQTLVFSDEALRMLCNPQ